MVPPNTNQDYNIYVSAGQDCRRKYNNTPSTAQLFIAPKVEVTYQSDVTHVTKNKMHRTWQSFTAPKSRSRKIRDNHKTQKLFQFYCDKLTSDDGTQSSSSWDFISGMISDLKLPFSLDLKLQWRVQDRILKLPHEEEKPWTPLENQDDLIRKILELARCMAKEDSNTGHQVTVLFMTIEKEVILPHNEFEAMVRDRAEKERAQNIDATIALMVDRQILLARNLSQREWRRRIDDELRNMDVTLNWDSLESLVERASTETEEGILVGLKRAKSSSIRALENVKVRDVCIGSTCSICMEEFVFEYYAKRMPCLHTFHVDCIEEWLYRSHMCPLCRFKLPTQ